MDAASGRPAIRKRAHSTTARQDGNHISMMKVLTRLIPGGGLWAIGFAAQTNLCGRHLRPFRQNGVASTGAFGHLTATARAVRYETVTHRS